MGLCLPLPWSLTDHLILPVALSMAWPMIVLLFLEPANSGKVARYMVSPQMAMPPWPSLGSGAFHRMFWLAATLQWVGASGTSPRQVPSGPPAWTQFTTAPPGEAGGFSSPPLPPL